jgi:hypothetical protein
LTEFNVENAGNGCMNPAPYTDCFLIHVEGIRREKVTRKERETVKRSDSASLSQFRE